MERAFVIFCVERNQGGITAVGGYFEDEESWHQFSELRVLKLIREGDTAFFTEGQDGSFTPVHPVSRGSDSFIQTNPDHSLPDNLEFLPGCGDFRLRVLTKLKDEVLQRFQEWRRTRSAARDS